jgi:CSLREA domain-containing protein
MNRIRKMLLVFLFLGLIQFMFSPLPAEASTLVVNTDDDLDDGLCNPAHCSLREAINAANASPGPDTIAFDIPGSTPVSISLNSPLPALTDDATTIDGTSEPDYAGDPIILLAKAAGVMEVGLDIQSNDNEIRGLHLAGFGGFPSGQSNSFLDYIGGAIVITGTGNLIQANEIGMGAWWNSVGVRIEGAGNTVIGNVISGNSMGIYANHPNQVIQSNIIGPGADGVTAVHNNTGIVLDSGADGTLVGGAGPNEGNVLSANHNTGLYSHANGTVLYGNIIGLDQTGTSALPNEGNGITLTEEDNIVGGSAAGQGNVISGNDDCGIWISDQGSVIQGNKIGTDISGSIMIPNGWCGIETEAEPSITIGGLNLGEGNLIMGNGSIGVWIDDLGKGSTVAGNTIALNGKHGIEITSYDGSDKNTFTRNSIYQNGDLGIKTNWENNNIQPPVLTSAVGFSINGTTCSNCLVEFFRADPDPTGFGEGKEFIGDTLASSLGVFSFATGGAGFCTPITTTATDADGNTSEFSQNIHANCILIQPPFLYPIWIFIIIVFAGLLWLLRRRVPTMRAWFIPLGAFAGGFVLLLLAMAVPFAEVDLVPRSTCGDGVVNAAEQCDGDDLTMCLSGQVCENCRCMTLMGTCGDGVVGEDEQCDGDDLTMCLSGQVCKSCRCTTMLGCGNGVVDEGEQCDGDDLSFCLSGQVCEGCRCITKLGCGNGIVEAGEQCDGDDLSFCLSGQVCEGCRCITKLGCGNGIVEEGEQCDGDDLTMCLSGQVCQGCRCITMLELCGNGVVDEGEQCDGDDLSMCLSGQVCEGCKCVTHMESPKPEICIYEAAYNSNCRESDYKESAEIAIVMEGESGALIGLNPEYTHGQFELENGRKCWMWLGVLIGEENPFGECDVPILDPPEKPSAPACHRELSEEDCIAAGGEWVSALANYCNCPED